MTQTQTKRQELTDQLALTYTLLSEARKALSMDPSAVNADKVRNLRREVENLEVAIEAVNALEQREAESLTSDKAKTDLRDLADLEGQASHKADEILKALDKLTTLFSTLEAIADQHHRISGRYGRSGLKYKSDYKRIFALKQTLDNWADEWRRYQKNKGLQDEPYRPRQLTDLQKKVDAMRYHDKDEPVKAVRLIENDPGPVTDPKKIRVGG